MAKKVLLILAEGFEEIEAVAPIDLLRRAGAEVRVAGLAGTVVRSARGLPIQAERSLDRVRGDFYALILPGGGDGARNLAASAKVRSLILEMFQAGKWVCAICAAPVLVLSPTGILDGKSATCYRGMESGFGKSVKYAGQKVVVDGNVITSQGPGTAVDFALAVIEKLCGKKESDRVREDILAS